MQKALFQILLGGVLATPLHPQPKIIDLGDFTEDVRITSNLEYGIGSDLAVGDFNADGYDDVLIGALSANTDEGFTVGKAYILFGGTALPSFIDYGSASQFMTVIHGDNQRDYTGRSVTTGDVNGDGIDDAIVGAPQLFQFVGGGWGVTYIIYGRKVWPKEIDLDTDGLGMPGVTRVIGKDFEDFSAMVASGDVNNDGYIDVVIGGFAAGPPGCCGNEGEVYVLFGADSLGEIIELANTKAQVATIRGTQEEGRIGEFVGCEDLNNDSFSDILIGNPEYDRKDNTGPNIGKIYAIHGDTILPAIIDLDSSDVDTAFRMTQIMGAESLDQIGWTFDSGDVNGDGTNDLLIGTNDLSESSNYFGWAGVMQVLFGVDSHPENIDLFKYTNHIEVLERQHRRGGYPDEVAAGDVNGDGIDDIIAGAPWAGTTGQAYVIFGRPEIAEKGVWAISQNDHDIEIRGYSLGQLLGKSLAAGDINGDGIDDIIVGAEGTENVRRRFSNGAVYIIYGRRDGDTTFVPARSQLLANYPNPFNSTTFIPYDLRESQHITLRVHNVMGQLVQTLVDGWIESGSRRAVWSGQDQATGQPAPSGVYFLRLQGETFAETRKILFLK